MNNQQVVDQANKESLDQAFKELAAFKETLKANQQQAEKSKLSEAEAYEDERSKPVKDDWPKKVVQPEIPLDIEQAASKWADSQYSSNASAGKWIAARNGYRQCWRDMQTKPDWVYEEDGKLENMPEEKRVVDVVSEIGNIGPMIIRNVYRIRYWWYNEDGIKLMHIAPYAWKEREQAPPLKPE